MSSAAFEQNFRQLRRTRWRMTFGYIVLFLVAMAISVYVGEVNFPLFLSGMPMLADYVRQTIPTLTIDNFSADLGEWMWGVKHWLLLLFDTIVIAFLGSLLGGTLAFIFSFPASRNLVESTWICFTARRVMEVARTVPELVYALILVFAFGVGPFAGMLALAIHTWGALGKLMSEVNENIDMAPLEGVTASGANWLEVIRAAVVPQVMPNFLSYALFRFEINVRAATVLGLVGAGGIGGELYLVIRQFEYTDISAIVVLIVMTVAIIDMASEHLRHRIIWDGGRGDNK